MHGSTIETSNVEEPNYNGTKMNDADAFSNLQTSYKKFTPKSVVLFPDVATDKPILGKSRSNDSIQWLRTSAGIRFVLKDIQSGLMSPPHMGHSSLLSLRRPLILLLSSVLLGTYVQNH